MNSDGIEDILISREPSNTKKKKPKFIFVLFFMLLIILVGFVAAYWYLTKDNVSSKQLFVQNFSQININKLLKNEVYTNLIDKIQNESSQINSSVKLTTDLEKEKLQDIDVTKFNLNISSSNDVENKKSYSEADLKYSGNEVFKVKLICSENEIAVASDEIMNQYVGAHIDKIKEIFGINIDTNRIKELSNSESINLSEEESNKILKKYFDLLLNNIPEEKFSIQENIAIENATENVEVTNYCLNLSQEEFNTLTIKVLEELKNDEELMKKILLISEEDSVQIENTNKLENTQTEDSENIQIENTINDQTETTNEVINETIQTEELEPDIPVIHVNPVGTINVSNEANITATESTQETSTSEIEENNITDEGEDVKETEIIETTDIEELIDKEENPREQITNIFFGKKANLTKKEFNNFIDELIKTIENLSGNGLIVNIYSSANNIEKLNVALPKNDILEIDFIPDENPELNSNQSYIKITYLEENESSEKNGFSLEINKEQSTANTTINAEYSFIENEKINQKVKISMKTDGTVNSKLVKNDIVLTVATNKTETQIAIDNEIEFKEITDLPGINSENCIYLDLLPEEERNTLIDTIKNQVMTLYTSKKENLNFIDTNTYSQTTLENQNQTSLVTREKAKEDLINKIVAMMDDAIAKGEEFTIQNLVDLKIDGYKVSSAVTSDSAMIVVDVYKFNIDKDFVLTDVE